MYRLIKARKIPTVRTGRQWRFRKHDIAAWLDSQNTGPVVPASVPPPPRNGRMRVLAVGNEASIHELLQKTLALAEHDVDTAGDGATALRLLRDAEYDLPVADLKMPGVSSYLLKPFGVPDVLSAASKALGAPSVR